MKYINDITECRLDIINFADIFTMDKIYPFNVVVVFLSYNLANLHVHCSMCTCTLCTIVSSLWFGKQNA